MKKILMAGLIVLLSLSLFAERKALVIGNSNYAGMTLAAPSNDINAMSTALGSWGFNVSKRANLSYAPMRAAIDSFLVSLSPQDEALFYFSGFNGSDNSNDFLLPAGSNPGTLRPSAANAIGVRSLMDSLAYARNSIVILEASRTWAPQGSRALSKPLHWVGSKAPTKQVVVYATAPDRVVPDLNAERSIFTLGFINAMETTDSNFLMTMPGLISEIMQATQQRQVPWFAGSPGVDYRLNPNIYKGQGRYDILDLEGGGSLSW